MKFVFIAMIEFKLTFIYIECSNHQSSFIDDISIDSNSFYKDLLKLPYFSYRVSFIYYTKSFRQIGDKYIYVIRACSETQKVLDVQKNNHLKKSLLNNLERWYCKVFRKNSSINLKNKIRKKNTFLSNDPIGIYYTIG